MKYKVYAVHDTKAEAYMMPFFMTTEGQAVRGFADAVNNPETPFGQHPYDYTLFHIGEYSDAKGELIPCTPRSLGNGVELQTAQKTEFESLNKE